MNYASIKNCDIANGEGVRVTLFVSGCTNHCENCFQPETWDFGYGEPFTPAVEDQLIEMLRPGFINGLTLLGGSASIWSRIVFTLVGLAALCGIPGLFTEETEE